MTHITHALSLTLVALALTGARTTAQVSVSTVAQTPIDVRASSPSGTNGQVLPAGTPLINRTLNASAPGAASSWQIQRLGDGARINATWQSQMFRFASASGTVRLTLSTPVPTPGSLQITLTGGSATIDLAGDGSIEFDAPFFSGTNIVETRPLILDSAGAIIDLTSNFSGSSFPPFFEQHTMEVRFVPGAAGVPTLGQNCFASLAGNVNVDSNGDLNLRLEGRALTTDSFGLFVFGVNPNTLPLPGRGCSLLIDPLIALAANPDAMNRAVLDLPVPALIGAGGLRVQYLTFDSRLSGLVTAASAQINL